MNTKTSQRYRRSNAGFTLVEIMIVVVIIGIIAGFAIGPVADALRRGRIASVVGAIDNAKKATVGYITKPGSLGVIPITEGTIPSTQFSGTGTTSSNVAAASSLDQVFLGEGLFGSPVSIKMGPQTSVTTGVGTTWNPASGVFTATAAPTRDLSTTTRFESQLSTATTPSTAAGSNFMLDGVNNLPSNARVVSLIIPNVPAEDAYQLSLTVDGANLTPANNGAADAMGVISYAAPTNGVTTVYCYVIHN